MGNLLRQFYYIFFLRMKGEMMTDNGSRVAYERIKGSHLFKQYCSEAQQLRSADLSKLSDAEKKAFFISILFVCFSLSDVYTLSWVAAELVLQLKTYAYDICDMF